MMFKKILLLLLLLSVNISAQIDTFQCAASGDEAGEDLTDTWQTTGTAQYIGRNGAVHLLCAMRFPNVTIAQGTTIDSAWLVTSAAGTSTQDPNNTYFGEDTSNATAVTSAADWAARIQTTANVNITNYSDWGATGANGWYPHGDSSAPTDFGAIVQEIVNRGDWSSGNALQILVQNNDGDGAGLLRYMRTYDYATNVYGAKLIIYTGGGATDVPQVIMVTQ